MPYMIGAAKSLKQEKYSTQLRNISTKGGKRKRFRGSPPKLKGFVRRGKSISTGMLVFAMILVLGLSIGLTPALGIGGVIVPVVLVSIFFFVAAAVRSIFEE